MSYHNIPVKDETYEILLKLIQGKESWDETLKRVLIHYMRLIDRYEEE